MKTRRIKEEKLLKTAITVLSIGLCLALCASTIAVYRDGLARRAASGSATEQIFTAENIALSLRRLLPLFLLWLAAVIAGFAVLGPAPLRPKAVRAPAPAKTPENALAGAVRAALLVAAAVLLALGIGNGGQHDVLVKAINICTECIGLG